MTAAGHHSRDQAKLWLIAFGVSAALNALILLVFALEVMASLVFMPSSREVGARARAAEREESIALIVPDTGTPGPLLTPAETKAEPPPAPASYARTSKDQEAARPERPAFIGERNTRATSDLPPESQAAALPNQEGEEPDNEGDMETTVSRYQDGDLAHDQIARPDARPASSDLPAGPDAPEPMRQDPSVPPPPAPSPAAAAREKLAEGTLPVEREVKDGSATTPPKEAAPAAQAAAEPQQAEEEMPKEAEAKKTELAETREKREGKDTPPTRPAPSVRQAEPGFRGYQYKHRIHGSISRQGRSALDVEDSVLGRYHAALSRAVEREWQRNCVRNRDFITPGQIIVRFVLEANGKVRSVNFIEEFGVGNIQKGFTSESIRAAEIPPFPAEMKKQLGGEPLEVTYSFIF